MSQVFPPGSTNTPSPRLSRMKGVGLNTTQRLSEGCCGDQVGMEGRGFGLPKAVILRKLRRSMRPSIGACNLRSSRGVALLLHPNMPRRSEAKPRGARLRLLLRVPGGEGALGLHRLPADAVRVRG